MLFSCLLLRLWVNFNIFLLYDHDTKIFIVGMFYGILLHMLHNCIFVDFFGLIEGMKDCQITNKASLLSCVSSCFSGYVYFTTTLYTFWTATISFLLTEGMECCSMLQFVLADALFFPPQQSQLPTTSMRFGLIWSNDISMKLYASTQSDLSLHGLRHCTGVYTYILLFVLWFNGCQQYW